VKRKKAKRWWKMKAIIRMNKVIVLLEGNEEKG
jgi:hypothetical protein